ncbi:MAG TPA: response regulator [Chitinophagaceae bacterium]|nr:response regulator [Chitinophagaceae bacterium]
MITNNNTVHILLADDDIDDRFNFQYALSEIQVPVNLSSVEDGKKLMYHLAKMDKQLPDIIFLDINMPYKNGKECLKEIRNNNKFKHIPVVMFTTSAHKKDIDETYLKGANLYVTKPVFIADLVKILKRIFSFNWKENIPKPSKEKYVLSLRSL